MLVSWRNPLILFAIVFLSIFQAFLLSTIFGGVGSEDLGINFQKDVSICTNYLGFSFLITSDQFIICAFAMIMQIPQSYPVYMRETKNRMYRPTVYYFANLLSAICCHFFYPLFVSLGSFYFI